MAESGEEGEVSLEMDRTSIRERRQRQTVAESAGLCYQVTRLNEQNITGKLCA